MTYRHVPSAIYWAWHMTALSKYLWKHNPMRSTGQVSKFLFTDKQLDFLIFICFCYFVLWYWSLNSCCCACKASVLTLEPCPKPQMRNLRHRKVTWLVPGHPEHSCHSRTPVEQPVLWNALGYHNSKWCGCSLSLLAQITYFSFFCCC
jgi:hypothetical protein